MKTVITAASTVAAMIFGFWVFVVMFNYSYEASAAPLFTAAAANAAAALILGYAGRAVSHRRASHFYLLASWILILLCLVNLVGDNPIKSTWGASLGVLAGGLLIAFLGKPRTPAELSGQSKGTE